MIRVVPMNAAFIIIISVFFVAPMLSLPWNPVEQPPGGSIAGHGRGTAVADNAAGEIVAHVNAVVSPVLRIRGRT